MHGESLTQTCLLTILCSYICKPVLSFWENNHTSSTVITDSIYSITILAIRCNHVIHIIIINSELLAKAIIKCRLSKI